MPLSYKELSAPAAEPVTLEQAKIQCMVDDGDTRFDGLIQGLITAGRQYCEKIMNRCIFNRTMQMTMDFFPYPRFDAGCTVNPNDRHVLFGSYWHQLAIHLPKPGCVSVTSITYLDLSNNVQTFPSTSYTTDVNSEPARIVPMPWQWWPWSQNYIPGNVCIKWVAGTWGDGVKDNFCPMPIVQAILLLVSYWYNHRDAAESNPPKAIEHSVEALLSSYRFESFGWEC